MIDNDFLLEDRLQKIRQVINQYGEERFFVSFSGGKDSIILSFLIDLALPDNTIPRVYVNTGIEYTLMLEFVKHVQAQAHKWELHIINPSVPIRSMLNEVGYPFKSKKHSEMVRLFQKFRTLDGHSGLQHYLNQSTDGVAWSSFNTCPKKLLCQFELDYPLKISDQCCLRLKEIPLTNWGAAHNRDISIIGLLKAEGGRRTEAQCLAYTNRKLRAFQPLAPVSKDWEDWLIGKYNIELCSLYNEPYNFDRTGCKGCPFALHLQAELDTIEKYFPVEREQIEIIWAPVYAEYRRLHYRLKERN